MFGFGPVVAEADEPVFHEPWEGRTFALMFLSGAKRLRHGSVRPGIEAMPPADYLRASYYQRWAFAVEHGLVDAGTLTTEEIDARAGADPAPVVATTDPAFVDGFLSAICRPNLDPPAAAPAKFAVGDRVTVSRMAPAVHHRCPRYVRGVGGVVTHVRGGWPRPEPGAGPEPVTIYTVAFAMSDLWGADAEPGTLHLDLWEGYLA
jgi:nitrile hydratase